MCWCRDNWQHPVEKVRGAKSSGWPVDGMARVKTQSLATDCCLKGWKVSISVCMEAMRKEREGGDCMRVEGVGDSAGTEKWLWWNGKEGNMAVGSNPSER